MKLSVPNFVRTTTFRLAVVHAVMFTVFTLGLLVYVYHSTAGYLRRQSIAELDGTERVEPRIEQWSVDRSTGEQLCSHFTDGY